ncbi:Histidine kinase domain-containing protein [Sulfidibacter corallicola]|uniref:histidine kinase n=1 Tax=Sulfidibacter corallicola TaxID=2818388 RepID=A0A8A4TSS7_SULCO|nr:ATP-binding protein [Sulfidibacter corallicola]QTD53006.1 hypothetical protein J3U87_11135 [Sulfidibacter corallicola]
MIIRVISLILYRVVLVSMLLLYQVLALIFEFPTFAFASVLLLVALVSLLSLLYIRLLAKQLQVGEARSEKERRSWLNGLVLVQFLVDLILISITIYLTGAIETNLRFVYLAVILLSAVFLDKFSIYAIMVCSLSMYYSTLVLMVYPIVVPARTADFLTVAKQVNPYMIGQVVLCFFTALLSGFMQTAYRSSRRILMRKEENIRSLRVIRRKIVESLPGGLMTCDSEGDINFVNQMGLRLLQRTNNDLLYQNAWALFGLHPVTIPPRKPHGPISRVECRVTVKGTRRIFGVTFSPMEFESGTEGFLIVFQDLTKIKMLEENKRLAERMGALAKMAAGVAHEIRNPLAAISGSIQVLKEMVPPEETAQELADIVEKESTRLSDIISQFLNYARPGSPPDPRIVDLGQSVRDFVKLVRNDAYYSNLEIQVNLAEGDLTILGDVAKLNQVFWNLVRNSHEACGEKGLLILECREAREDVIFSIVDNGKGMSEDQLEDLFTPFQSFSRGTGLGMSIVYEIVQMHDGRIEVTSKVGEGTRIDVHFPKYRD